MLNGLLSLFVSMLERAESYWNKVHWLDLSWLALADLYTKVTLSSLREMLDQQINGTAYLDGAAIWGINMDVRGRRLGCFGGVCNPHVILTNNPYVF